MTQHYVESYGKTYEIVVVDLVFGAKPRDIIKCECGQVISQCRCMGPHNTVIVKCTHGRAAKIGPNAEKVALVGTMTEDEVNEKLIDGIGVDEITAAISNPETIAKLKTRPEDQPLPVANDLPSMHDKARKALKARRELGVKRYGQPLQPANGRNAALDAWEEALDGAAYGAQVVWEQEHPEHTYVGSLVRLLSKYVEDCAQGPDYTLVFEEGEFVPDGLIEMLESQGIRYERG